MKSRFLVNVLFTYNLQYIRSQNNWSVQEEYVTAVLIITLIVFGELPHSPESLAVHNINNLD